MTEVYELSASPPKFASSTEPPQSVARSADEELYEKENTTPIINDDVQITSNDLQENQDDKQMVTQDEINSEALSNQDETHDRAKLLAQLEAYNELFGHTHLKNMDFRNLSRKTLDELNELYRSCKFQLNTRQGFKSAHTMYLAGMSILEVTGKKTGLKLDGLTQIASHNTELHSLIDELAVQYIDKFNMPPEQRLVFATVQMVAQIHLINSAAEKNKPTPPPPSPPPPPPTPTPTPPTTNTDTNAKDEQREEIIKDL